MFENKNNPCFDFEDLEELWINLMDSTEKGDVDSIKKLIAHPYFRKIVNNEGNWKGNFHNTLLGAALKNNNLILLDALIEANVDTNVLFNLNNNKNNPNYILPIVYVSKYGNLNLFKHFLSKVKYLEENSPIFEAAKSGNFEIVKYLVEKQKDDLAKKGFNDEKLIKKLVINQVYGDGLSLLQCAAMSKNEDLIKYLLSQGADIAAIEAENGKTAMHIAAQKGNSKTMQAMFGRHANPTIETEEFFESPYDPFDSKTIESLTQGRIKTKNYVNEEEDCYFTPLECAVRALNVETVKFLLKKDAEIRTIDDNGEPKVLKIAKNKKTLIENSLKNKKGYSSASFVLKQQELEACNQIINALESKLLENAVMDMAATNAERARTDIAKRKARYGLAEEPGIYEDASFADAIKVKKLRIGNGTFLRK